MGGADTRGDPQDLHHPAVVGHALRRRPHRRRRLGPVRLAGGHHERRHRPGRQPVPEDVGGHRPADLLRRVLLADRPADPARAGRHPDHPGVPAPDRVRDVPCHPAPVDGAGVEDHRGGPDRRRVRRRERGLVRRVRGAGARDQGRADLPRRRPGVAHVRDDPARVRAVGVTRLRLRDADPQPARGGLHRARRRPDRADHLGRPVQRAALGHAAEAAAEQPQPGNAGRRPTRPTGRVARVRSSTGGCAR